MDSNWFVLVRRNNSNCIAVGVTDITAGGSAAVGVAANRSIAASASLKVKISHDCIVNVDGFLQVQVQVGNHIDGIFTRPSD